jgi:hypothetical protein
LRRSVHIESTVIIFCCGSKLRHVLFPMFYILSCIIDKFLFPIFKTATF